MFSGFLEVCPGWFSQVLVVVISSVYSNVVKTMPFAPSPSHHHFYRWYIFIYIYINHSQSWVVYDIVLPTLIDLAAAQAFQLSIYFFRSSA